MAHNVTLMGATYPDVPAIVVPSGNGTARYDDTSDADATDADIASGKTAYVGGVKVMGTATVPVSPTVTITDITGGHRVTITDIDGSHSFDVLDGDDASAVVSILSPSGNSHTLLPCPVTYNFGEKSTLTVTVTATSQYHFMFSCPSGSATVLTMTGITGTTGDTIEAGKTYEVDIWAGIALIKEIEVTAV